MKHVNNTIPLVIILIMIHGCIRDEVLLPPVITSFDKNPIPSGNILGISGKYFDPSTAQVFINDTLMSAAGTFSLTEARIFVPARKMASDVWVYVKTKYGTSNKERLTILPPVPEIRKVIPDKAGPGLKVKVTGTYLASAKAVKFKSPDQANPIDAPFTLLTGDTLEVTIPKGLSKDAADLRVETSSGISEPAAFTVLAPPMITSFVPEEAVAGSVVMITGKDLGPVTNAFIGMKEADILTLATDYLEIRVPANSISDTIRINGWGGNSKTSKKLKIIPPPTITSLDKTSGDAGTNVTINGSDFQGAFQVKFAATPAQIISNNGSVLKTKVPVGASSGRISVATLAGTAQSSEEFVVTGSPFISSFTPTTGGIGTKIVLNGINLQNVTSARIGLVNLKIISKSDTQIEVEVLTGSVTGKISVFTSGGTFETANTFVVSGTPQITSFTPTIASPGALITITGINFSSSPDVKFGTSTSAIVTKATATEIICQVPANATTGKINVNGALSLTDFTVSAKAVITSISPTKGGVDREITITGQYLTGATIKFFNNVTATKVGTGTDTQVIVKVPAGATTGKISITTAAGTTTSINDFQVLPAPTITSFSPTSGGTGASITINGTNLEHNPEVRFFNNVLGIIKSVTSNQLVAEVPVGAVTGKISVKTDAVVNAVSSSTDFVVLGKPTITSIVPASGTINEKVTINGINFNNATSVSFDGVSTSAFISVTATAIQIRVPASVNGSSNRTINVNVKTSVDNSNNQAFSLLGTPVITKLSPNNNPASWAFLIEGTNLGSVKKLALDGKVPAIGVNGIDKIAYNYITTKVPDDLKPATDQNKTLTLYYTSDNVGFTTSSYQVLSAPPPGVFPPPFIILPPPIPVNYVQSDISAYWENPHFVSVSGDSVHCFNIRGNFRDAADLANQSGTFCQFEEYYGIQGVYSNIRYWSGTWNKGTIQLTSGQLTMTGQVELVNGFVASLIFTDNNGRQLQLKFDSTGGCGIINSNGCENND